MSENPLNELGKSVAGGITINNAQSQNQTQVILNIVCGIMLFVGGYFGFSYTSNKIDQQIEFSKKIKNETEDITNFITALNPKRDPDSVNFKKKCK